ncbi:MAG: argininosuccinate synthase [bacterium]
MPKRKKVVLAYSGGLDTSVILRWLIEEYHASVIAVAVDLGQSEDMEAVRKKALDTGASKSLVVDAREEFVRDFIFPALQANARYEDVYLMGTSLARPVIAKHLVEVAEKEGAGYVSHGATGKGNDQVRFELTVAALAPELGIIAPWRDPAFSFSSRKEMMEYAKQHGIEVPVTQDKPYSSDANLMHVSYEGGILEDPWRAYDEDMFQMTVSPEEAPDEREELLVEFDQGVPVKLGNKKLKPAALLAEANRIGGRHGIGRVDMVENRFVGIKSRGVYETPGLTVLHAAHRAVESITVDREAMHLKDSLMPRYAELVYNGFWYAPERESIQAMVDKTQEVVTGTARLSLYKGNCMVTGRRSELSLYNEALVSFDQAGGYDQADATGFIRINALRLKTRTRRDRASQSPKKSGKNRSGKSGTGKARG